MKASDLTYYVCNIRHEVDRLTAFISTGPDNRGRQAEQYHYVRETDVMCENLLPIVFFLSPLLYHQSITNYKYT